MKGKTSLKFLFFLHLKDENDEKLKKNYQQNLAASKLALGIHDKKKIKYESVHLPFRVEFLR